MRSARRFRQLPQGVARFQILARISFAAPLAETLSTAPGLIDPVGQPMAILSPLLFSVMAQHRADCFTGACSALNRFEALPAASSVSFGDIHFLRARILRRSAQRHR